MTDQFKKFLAVILVGPLIIAGFAILTLVFGAVAGWVGGLIFPQVFTNLSELVFGRPVPAWQIGAMLGFVAGFLRASVSPRK